MNDTTTKTKTRLKRGTITEVWLGRDGYPRVKFAGFSKPFVVRQLLGKGDANTKTRKNAKRGYMTRSLSLSPHKESGIGNTCPHASAGCIAACLGHQGLASVFENIPLRRRAKTAVFYRFRAWFIDQLIRELKNAETLAARNGKDLAVRLNMFSDIPWEVLGIMDQFPGIHFYDYTKNPRRAGALLPNYWVTFSLSETNIEDALRVLAAGNNVAAVFADMSGPSFTANTSGQQTLPASHAGFKVISGDETDLRFLDERGSWVGLVLKTHSKAERTKAIESGFAITHNEKAES